VAFNIKKFIFNSKNYLSFTLLEPVELGVHCGGEDVFGFNTPDFGIIPDTRKRERMRGGQAEDSPWGHDRGSGTGET